MSIHLIIGPMFSGKTTELISMVNSYTHSGRKCIVLKNKIDNRYSENNVISHDGYLADKIISLVCESGTYPSTKDTDVVAIDEGHFFPDLKDFCVELAHTGVIVIVSAINGSYCQEPFKEISELIPYCDTISKRSAYCSCGSPASFTVKHDKSESKQSRIDVGGTDKYKAVCRKCL